MPSIRSLLAALVALVALDCRVAEADYRHGVALASAPSAPVVTGPTGIVTGVPVAVGTGASGATVTVFVDGVVQGTVVVNSNAWSLVLPQPTNGPHSITATQANASGSSPASNAVTFTRAVLPAAKVVTGRSLIQAPTNLLATTWVKGNATVGGSAELSPDGVTYFGALTDNPTSAAHQVYQNQLNPTTPGVYTASGYFKQGTLRYGFLGFTDNANGHGYGVVFDLQAGTITATNSVGSPTSSSSSIVACPDPVACPNGPSGVYYVSVSQSVVGAGANVYLNIFTLNSPTYTPVYAGNGQNLYVWNVSFTTPAAHTASLTQTPWNSAGYNVNTYHSPSFSPANVDTHRTKKSGFQWYLTGSFGFKDYSAANMTFNNDGSLTLSNAGLYSVAAKATPVTAWKGTAFGGGAYFEATFSFNPADVNNVSGAHGWPSFWADPVEHGAEQSVFSDNWVGQANGFVHFLEMDFFEYNVWGYDNKLFAYNGTVIDWSGVYVTGSAAGYPVHLQNTYNRQITVPVGADLTKPHSYGFLWAPATSSAQGYYQWYFDRRATSDRIYYNQYNCAAPPAPPMTDSSSSLFGVGDCFHPEIIINSSSTGSLRVYDIEVWQASSANNIVH
jgi:hypothetical protein